MAQRGSLAALVIDLAVNPRFPAANFVIFQILKARCAAD
jgi:hypothetical protein